MSKNTGSQDTLFKRRVLRRLEDSASIGRMCCRSIDLACCEVPVWISEYQLVFCEKHGEEYLNEKDDNG